MNMISKILRSPLYLAKSIADWTRTTGGWTVISGTDAYQSGSDLFKNYTSEQQEKIYQKSAIIYACIQRLSNAFIEASIDIGRETEDGWENDEENALYDVLKQPNSYQSAGTFFNQVLAHLLLTGVSYVVKVRNRGQVIQQLLPFPTSWIKKNRNNTTGAVTSYSIYQGSGSDLVVPIEDMIVIGFVDPNVPSQFVGPLQAASKEYDTDIERQNYLMEMLVNLKAPGLILKQELAWTDEQKTAARQRINDLIGKGKRGNPLFLEGQYSSAEMMAPLKDLDWPGLTTLSETRICAAFGIPPIVLGLRAGLEHATYSNYREAEKAFYRGTVNALWRFIGNELTRSLIWLEDDDSETIIKFNTSHVKQLQEDEKEAADRAVVLFKNGIATRNEARQIAGLDMVDVVTGDIFVLPLNLIETRLDGELAREMETGIAEEKTRQIDWKTKSLDEPKHRSVDTGNGGKVKTVRVNTGKT